MGQADAVDEIVKQWNAQRPDLDVSSMEIIGRISRLARLAERELARSFAENELENWEFDVLATLRRSNPPHELTAGELVRATLVTTGAMTNRVDRLVARGLVERAGTTDRRKIIVRLTQAGHELIDRAIVSHLRTEEQLLATLTPQHRSRLSNQLRALLVSLGDTADPGLS